MIIGTEMRTSTIVLISVVVIQVLASGFEWELRPSVQHACVGSDMVLHWKYKTETPVSMVLLQNLRTTLTLVECYSTAKDNCFVYHGFHNRVNVVEMLQGSAKYYFSNLTTSDSAVYMLQLIGPGIFDNSTLFVFSDDDLAVDSFVNNEQVMANRSYICAEPCDSVSVLVKTHDHLRANISFFDGNDENKLLLVCSNQDTCAYAHKQGNGVTRIKIEVNYGFCNKLISYLDISISGGGLSTSQTVTLVVVVLLLITVIVFVLLYKLKKLSYIRKLFRTSSSKASHKYMLQGSHCSNVETEDPEGAVPQADSPKVQDTLRPDVSPITHHQNFNSEAADKTCENGPHSPTTKDVPCPVTDLPHYSPVLQNRSADTISEIAERMENLKFQSPATKQKTTPEGTWTKYRDRQNTSDTSEDEQDTGNGSSCLSNGLISSCRPDSDEDVVMRDDPQKTSVC